MWHQAIRVNLGGVALAVFALFAAMYMWAPSAYWLAMKLWSVPAFQYPFVDAEYYITCRECFLRGVDVYASNPCDVLLRAFDNSPVWLRLPFIPSETAWTPVLGTIWCLGFFAALTLLPRVAGIWRWGVMLSALLSPAVALGVERANGDLPVFILIAAAVVLFEHGVWARAAAYGLVFAGFLLKFYPMVVAALALRERPRWLFGVAASAAALIALVVALYFRELPLAIANLPRPNEFGNDFGAHQFIDGIDHHARLGALRGVLLGAQIVLCAAAALLLSRQDGFGRAFASLGRREATALLTGALLICGCFLTGTSIGYRAMHLLFALPGLLAMAGAGSRAQLDMVWRATPVLCVLLMWNPFIAHAAAALAHLSPHASALAVRGVWVAREAGWWWLVTVLLAVVFRIAWEAPVLTWVFPARPAAA